MPPTMIIIVFILFVFIGEMITKIGIHVCMYTRMHIHHEFDVSYVRNCWDYTTSNYKTADVRTRNLSQTRVTYHAQTERVLWVAKLLCVLCPTGRTLSPSPLTYFLYFACSFRTVGLRRKLRCTRVRELILQNYRTTSTSLIFIYYTSTYTFSCDAHVMLYPFWNISN